MKSIIVEFKTEHQIIFPFSEINIQNNGNKSSLERENQEIWRLVVTATIQCYTSTSFKIFVTTFCRKTSTRVITRLTAFSTFQHFSIRFHKRVVKYKLIIYNSFFYFIIYSFILVFYSIFVLEIDSIIFKEKTLFSIS